MIIDANNWTNSISLFDFWFRNLIYFFLEETFLMKNGLFIQNFKTFSENFEIKFYFSLCKLYNKMLLIWSSVTVIYQHVWATSICPV